MPVRPKVTSALSLPFQQIELAVDLLGFGCPLLSRHHSQRCQLVQLTPRSASGDILCCKGHTDLHHLLRYGDLGKIQMLRMMLAAGADPFCRDATGEAATATYRGIIHGECQCVCELLPTDCMLLSLAQAASQNQSAAAHCAGHGVSLYTTWYADGQILPYS